MYSSRAYLAVLLIAICAALAVWAEAQEADLDRAPFAETGGKLPADPAICETESSELTAPVATIFDTRPDFLKPEPARLNCVPCALRCGGASNMCACHPICFCCIE